MPKPPPPDSRFWKVFQAAANRNMRICRASNGRFGGRMVGTKARILILHHVGRKSGTQRATPLIYVFDGDDLAIVASKGGVDKHPAWFHNVVANPDVEVDLAGGERRAVRARVAEGEERERWWRRAVESYPPYEDYQSYTERKIPIVLLEKR